RKFAAALAGGLTPVLCVGETLEEREAKQTEAVVGRQVDAVIAMHGAGAFAQAVLAYEPVWAIGTGRTATPEQAQLVHAFIRVRLREKFGEATAGRGVVQYGGRFKAESAADLLAGPDTAGAPVGGPSLKPADFLGIVDAARSVTESGK